MAISSRVFGSKVSSDLKKRIETLQKLSQRNSNPNELIDDREIQEILNVNSKFSDHNKDISAYLSSKTTIARLWTCVEVAEDVDMGQTFNSKDELSAHTLQDDEWIKVLDDTYELHKWVYTPESRKIYTIGNHTLNTLEKNPNSQMTEGAGDISQETMKILTPFEQETNMNAFLKPPSGITGVSWETDGPLGVIKKATVKFSVHNFSDFERIYMKYFLRPGAHVFLDVGYDTAALYDPKELIENDIENINQKLYGSEGFIEASKGDLDVLNGYVMDYDSSSRTDGGFDCSITIVSKNTAMADTPVDKMFKKRVEKGLQQEILGLALSGRMDKAGWYEGAKQWNASVETREELDYILKLKAEKVLGGKDSKMPGDDLSNNGEDAKFVISEGVYFGGFGDDEMKVFVNYGFVEDKILNRELALADDKKDNENENNKNKTGNPGDDMKPKFDSRNSFVTYSKNLYKAMEHRHGFKDAFFLYPADWGHKYATYNTKRRMVPDDRINMIGDDDKYEQPGTDAGSDKESIGDIESTGLPRSKANLVFGGSEDIISDDKKKNKIPLREIFIELDAFKEIIKGAGNAIDILQGICDRMNKASFDITQMKVNTNTYSGHTMSITDLNVVADADGNQLKPGGTARKDFLDSLIKFKPFSPDTIVKDYSFEYNMPEGGLGSILAIQNIGDSGRHLSVDQLTEGLFADQEINTHSPSDSPTKNMFVKWLPRDGKQAGQRMIKNMTQGSTQAFSFDEDDILYDNRMKKKGKVSAPNVALSVQDTTWGQLNYSKEMAETLGVDGLTAALSDDIQIEGIEVDEEGDPQVTTAGADGEPDTDATLLDSEYEFYATQGKRQMTQRNNTLLQITLSLTIYGTSGLMPGDLIAVDYLPSQYLDNCFFQVMKVSHEVGGKWTTTLETVMRTLPPLNPIQLEDRHAVRLKTEKLCEMLPGMEVFKPYLTSDSKPIDMRTHLGEKWYPKCQNISSIWEIHFKKAPPKDTVDKSGSWYMFVQINKKKNYKSLKNMFNHYNSTSKDYYGDDRLQMEDDGFEGWYNDYVYQFKIQEEKFTETENSDVREDRCTAYVVFSHSNNWVMVPPTFFIGYYEEISNMFAFGQETYFEGTET